MCLSLYCLVMRLGLWAWGKNITETKCFFHVTGPITNDVFSWSLGENSVCQVSPPALVFLFHFSVGVLHSPYYCHWLLICLSGFFLFRR